MKKTFLILFTVIWSFNNINAQSSTPEVISTTGGTYQGNTVQIDWTLGELAVTAIQNSSSQITQGFHQPKYIITSTSELPKEIGQISVFPNPTSDRIEMQLAFDQNQKIQIQLIDINGVRQWSMEKHGQTIDETISIGALPDGNYFLNFFLEGHSYHQTFKIQKFN